jgi:hypothetical protein
MKSQRDEETTKTKEIGDLVVQINQLLSKYPRNHSFISSRDKDRIQLEHVRILTNAVATFLERNPPVDPVAPGITLHGTSTGNVRTHSHRENSRSPSSLPGFVTSPGRRPQSSPLLFPLAHTLFFSVIVTRYMAD